MASLMSNSSFGKIPSGTTANRPASPAVGDQYYNGTLGYLEIYTSSGWKPAGGIPSGNTAGRPSSPSTGQPYFNGELQRLELYTGAQYGWQNIVAETPGVTGYTGSVLESNTTNTITITGTNFASGAVATLIGTDGTEYAATTTTVSNLTQVIATFGVIPTSKEPYDIRVTNPSNLYGVYYDILTVNNSPVWQTPSGSLGTFADNVSISVSATAADPDSTISYSLASGSSLPSGITLNSSTGVISGTSPDVASNTTYTFTINASDGANTVVPRTFSFTVNAAPTWVTSAGSLGGFTELTSLSIQLSATDPSDSLTYSLASGSSLPSGVTLSSSGLISGTVPDVAVVTTYNFTVNVSDGVNTIPRAFSFAARPIISMEVLLVGGGASGGYGNQNEGGGGGGAGGLLYTTSYQAVLGSSIALSVGTGGSSVSSSNAGNSGSSTTFGSFTALGGGAGGGGGAGSNGGSGGGGGGAGSAQVGGSATQTSQSPFTGYGNSGGPGSWVGNGYGGGGGGGGAGGAGANGQNYLSTGGPGGAGLAYSITGSSVTYAVGGYGGKGQNGNNAYTGTDGSTYGSGGQGNGTGNSSGRTGNGAGGVIIIAYPDTNPAITSIPGTLTYDQPTRSGYRVYRFTAGTGTITF